MVARESAFAYKDSAESPGRIGRELGARFLLRGSLRREGQQLRLNVRLIDTRDGRALWAERYDRQLDDIFRIQDELAAEIVSALEVKLAPEDRRRLARNHEASVEAYDELLRGLAHYGRRTIEDNEAAKGHYERAIELDPRYARAYAALALTHIRDAVDGWATTTQGSMERAEELVEQATKLDPRVPQIYFVRGQIALYRGNHAEAVREIEEAIACLQAMPTPMRCSPGCCTTPDDPQRGWAPWSVQCASTPDAIDIPAGAGRDSLCSRRRCERPG